MTDKPLPVDPLSDPYDWGHEGIPKGTPIYYVPGCGWIMEKDPPPPCPPTEEQDGETNWPILLVGFGLVLAISLFITWLLRDQWL